MNIYFVVLVSAAIWSIFNFVISIKKNDTKIRYIRGEFIFSSDEQRNIFCSSFCSSIFLD